MKITIVGSTGNIGSRLTRKLLEAGHQVRALSRGGHALDVLVAQGAEPFIGSFDFGTGELHRFFDGADAAFTMVKTNWSDLHGHYPAAAARMVSALRYSRVKLVVNLSSFGAEVPEGTGHFIGFHDLEQGMNRFKGARIVHLRAGYFMENVVAWVDAVARYDRMAYYFKPDVKLPLIATQDIADVAFAELNKPVDGTGPTFVEIGGEDLSKNEMTAIISREIGRAVDYVHVPTNSEEAGKGFMAQFGNEEKWLYDRETHNAMNNGTVRLHPGRAPVAITFATFVRDTWRPAYQRAVAERATRPDNFRAWLAGSTRKADRTLK